MVQPNLQDQFAEAGENVRVLDLAPISFSPANNTSKYVVEQGGLGQLCTQQGAAYFVAPLRLPAGTVINGIEAFVRDTNADAVAMLSLVRRRTEDFRVLAMTGVSEGTGQVEMLSAGGLDYRLAAGDGAHTYLLQALLTGPGVCLLGARVTYRAP